jgi:hypothetical protein
MDKIRVYYTNKTLELLIIKALRVVGIKMRDKNKILVCSLLVYIMWKLPRLNTQGSWRDAGKMGRRTGEWRIGEWRGGDYYAEIGRRKAARRDGNGRVERREAAITGRGERIIGEIGEKTTE